MTEPARLTVGQWNSTRKQLTVTVTVTEYLLRHGGGYDECLTFRGIHGGSSNVNTWSRTETIAVPQWHAFYAFYAWWAHFPQSGALAEGSMRSMHSMRGGFILRNRGHSHGHGHGTSSYGSLAASMRSMRSMRGGIIFRNPSSRPMSPSMTLVDRLPGPHATA